MCWSISQSSGVSIHDIVRMNPGVDDDYRFMRDAYIRIGQ